MGAPEGHEQIQPPDARFSAGRGTHCARISLFLFQRLFHDTAAHRLLLQQLLRQDLMGLVVVIQQFLSPLVLFGDHPFDFGIDQLT